MIANHNGDIPSKSNMAGNGPFVSWENRAHVPQLRRSETCRTNYPGKPLSCDTKSPSDVTPKRLNFPSVATPFSPHLRHSSLLGFWGGVRWGGTIPFMYPHHTSTAPSPHHTSTAPSSHKHCTFIMVPLTEPCSPHVIFSELENLKPA